MNLVISLEDARTLNRAVERATTELTTGGNRYYWNYGIVYYTFEDRTSTFAVSSDYNTLAQSLGRIVKTQSVVQFHRVSNAKCDYWYIQSDFIEENVPAQPNFGDYVLFNPALANAFERAYMLNEFNVYAHRLKGYKKPTEELLVFNALRA